MFSDFFEKLNIKRRVLLLVMTGSIVSIVVISAISLFGILMFSDYVTNTGEELGKEAIRENSEMLEAVAKKHLVNMSEEQSRQIDARLEVIRNNIRIISARVTEMVKDPNIPRRRIEPPRKEDAGKVTPQLIFYTEEDKNSSVVADEVAVLANIQRILLQTVEQNKWLTAAYVASDNGFIIMADKIPEKKFSEGKDTPALYNAKERPWYKNAMENAEPTFTGVINDIHGGGLCIVCSMPYYKDGNFAGAVGIGAYLRDINKIVSDARIGESGFGFVLDNEGKIIFSPQKSGELRGDLEVRRDLRKSENKNLAEVAKKMVEGQSDETVVAFDNEEYYIAYCPMSEIGWSYASVIKVDEVMEPASSNEDDLKNITKEKVKDMRFKSLNIICATLEAVFLLLAIMFIAGTEVAERFTKPILALNKRVKEIAAGDLDRKIEVTSSDEIGSLAVSINVMTISLKEYMENLTQMTADKERISTELNLAKNIQAHMLPSIFPAFPERDEFDIYAIMNVAKEVGGDFYAFYLLDDEHLAITIADVSGKGVPAAMFMVISRTIIKNYALASRNKENFGEVITAANKQLCQNNTEMMFVTVFFGVLNIKTKRFHYVNAGHSVPLVYRASEDSFKYLPLSNNCMMGVRSYVEFQEEFIDISSGDVIFLYTDGVTEAVDGDNEEYGTKRLLNKLNALPKDKSLQRMLNSVLKDIKEHTGELEQYDDITMLALRIN